MVKLYTVDCISKITVDKWNFVWLVLHENLVDECKFTKIDRTNAGARILAPFYWLLKAIILSIN